MSHIPSTSSYWADRAKQKAAEARRAAIISAVLAFISIALAITSLLINFAEH